MLLHSVRISRFRSIRSAEVANCGPFNVIIGKNNSGKSNILSAIQTFFICLGKASTVELEPPVGQVLDFFERKLEAPIEIALSFGLHPDERQAIVDDIASEAPQLTNALGSIPDARLLVAKLTITAPPSRFAYVSALSLLEGDGPQQRDSERHLLKMGSKAAMEFRDKLASARSLLREVEGLHAVLRSIDSAEYDSFKRTSSERVRPPLAYVLRELRGISREVAPTVEALVRDTSTFEEFVREVSSLAEQREEKAATLGGEPISQRIETFAGQEDQIPRYVSNLLNRLAAIRVHHLRDRRTPIGKEEAERLLTLKVRRGGSEALRNIQETVSALLGVRVDAYEGEPDPRARPRGATAELDVDDFLAEANGSGIREALRLILDVEFQKPQILLVEEPEIHLHPALETSMMRYLKGISKNCQVLLTTHSTNFLDTADMQNVYLVSRDGSTSIQLMNLNEVEAQLPKELGIRLSSLFLFDRLVFVEGPSDEAVLREWASKLGVNFGQTNVGFVAMGGVRNFTHYAAEQTLSFLTKRQVKTWFVMDRDERDETEVAKLTQAYGQTAKVTFLQRREIENYLVCARPLAELIRLKQESSNVNGSAGVPVAGNVEEYLRRCADELKHVAIEKRVVSLLCRPVHPHLKRVIGGPVETPIVDRIGSELDSMIGSINEAKSKLELVYKEQEETVDTAWEAKKLELVPGDLLLDKVCQAYGVRFKKERDSPALAALFARDEIPDELANLIREVGESA